MLFGRLPAFPKPCIGLRCIYLCRFWGVGLACTVHLFVPCPYFRHLARGRSPRTSTSEISHNLVGPGGGRDLISSPFLPSECLSTKKGGKKGGKRKKDGWDCASLGLASHQGYNDAHAKLVIPFCFVFLLQLLRCSMFRVAYGCGGDGGWWVWGCWLRVHHR